MNSVQRQLHEAHKARRERLGAKTAPNIVTLPQTKKYLENRDALREAALAAAAERARQIEEQRRTDREREIEQKLLDALPPELLITETPVINVPSLAEIRREVSEYFDISQMELMGIRRNSKLVLARHIAYFVARNITGASFTQIGRAYKRDHSSVVHACFKMDDLVKTNSLIAGHYKFFVNKLAYRQAPHSYWGA